MTPRQLAAILEAEESPPTRALLPTSGRTVEIATLLRREERHPERIDTARSCWAPNKPTLVFEGRRTWAEYVLIRLLERHGWEGRWIKNWAGGREFCLEIDQPRPLPGPVAETFARIHRRAEALRGAGSWDVLGWSPDTTDYVFIESKKFRSGDALRPNQLAWLEAALLEGFAPDAFAIVEYDPVAR